MHDVTCRRHVAASEALLRDVRVAASAKALPPLLLTSWPIRMAWHAPVCVLYTLLVPSADAVTSFCPFMLKATSKISSLCPRNVLRHWPLSTFQTLHVRSIEPLMQSVPLKSNCVDEISPLRDEAHGQ